MANPSFSNVKGFFAAGEVADDAREEAQGRSGCMTGALEIKITISEFVTPALFQAMAAVSNPRQRAALLKRLAEDALRGNRHARSSRSRVGVVGGRRE